MSDPAFAIEPLRRRREALLGLGALLGGCALPPPPSPASPTTVAATPMPAGGAPPATDMPPAEPREFRAAWVATVAHIDWPSRAGLDPEAQRAEARALLDRARSLGLNAVVLQVRPAGDAFYPSALEPWSEWLTGSQGRAPDPPWDPLAFWIAEAHARALELHAWFNPFRARHSAAKSPLAPTHLARREPAVVRRYGEQLWADPGEPAAVAHTLAVVADVLARYDVDGVHVDDYFYPYPVVEPGAEPGTELPFPDDAAYARHRAGGGTLARADWRRANVDAFVQALHALVRARSPHVRLGISPFGIGRPDRRAPGITGFSQYDKLYADVERWLEAGWLDYLAPQLYWPIERAGQPFGALLDHWIGANRLQRHLWPGLLARSVRGAAGPARPEANWPARELLDQVALLRTRAGAGGHIHFSLGALTNEREGLATLLQFGPYAQPALVPATPWLDGGPTPATPRLLLQGNRVRIEAPVAPARWAVWRRIDGQWRFAVQAAPERWIDPMRADLLAVSGVGRTGQVGARGMLALAG